MSKANWQTVRFGDMAQHIGERVQPDDATVDRYVGLEHLDPESLKIRRWGSPDDVGATKLRFYPGDIIFGKRRFYQRKLAVADFEGICSAHAMVLRAKPDIILPEFLPFFMQSETFFERAMSISVGSLSPTINWSTLQRQEFALPPLDEQRRIAEVLTAVEEVNEKYRLVYESSNLALRVVQSNLIKWGLAKSTVKNPLREEFEQSEKTASLLGDWEEIRIEEKLAEIIDYRGRTPVKTDAGVPLITAKNIREGYLDPEPREFISEKTYTTWMTRGIPKPGDLFFTTEAPLGNVAKVPSYRLTPGQRIITLRPDTQQLDSDFLYWLLTAPRSQAKIRGRAHGTTVIGIKQSEFRKIEFRFPSVSEQKAISSQLNILQQATNDAEKHLFRLREMKKGLLSKLLDK
jgi:type I restriction enzyme, S subunit